MPGVPDVYQGTELWDLSLVDPDNRRPVDYALRRRLLARTRRRARCRRSTTTGAAKLLVVSRALRARRDHPEWFAGYEPVEARGAGGRPRGRLRPGRRGDGRHPAAGAAGATTGWGDTALRLPTGAWRDLLTGAAGGLRRRGRSGRRRCSPGCRSPCSSATEGWTIGPFHVKVGTVQIRGGARAPGKRTGTERLWAAYLSGGFGLSVSAMLGLLVPLRADQLGISVGAIGVIVAARSLAETVLTVPLSALTARLGTRRAYVVSTSACAVVSAAFALAESLWSLLLLNAVIGATRSMGWVASQTYISSQGPKETRARDTGRFSFVSNAGQMVSPLLVGAVAAGVGYRWGFLAAAGYCAFFALVGLALAPPRQSATGDRVRLRQAGGLFRLPRIQMAMLLTFVRLWVPNIWTPLFPLLLVSGGAADAALAGVVVASAAAVATVVNLFTGQLSRLAPPEVLCWAALALAVVGLAISPFLLSVPAAFLPAALVGIGNGLSLPLLIVLVSQAVPREQRGLALATRNAVNAFSATVGPLGTGWLVAGLGATAAFPVVGGVASVLLVGVLALRGRISDEPAAAGTVGTAPGAPPGPAPDPVPEARAQDRSDSTHRG